MTYGISIPIGLVEIGQAWTWQKQMNRYINVVGTLGVNVSKQKDMAVVHQCGELDNRKYEHCKKYWKPY